MTQQYLQIATASIGCFEFLPTPDGDHIPVQYWPDIRHLHGITFTPFKVFVHQQENGSTLGEAKLFICHFIEAENKMDAINQGCGQVNVLLNHISILYSFGAQLMHDETIVIHRAKKAGFQISNLDLKIKDGIVDSFSIFDSNSLRTQGGNLIADGVDSKITYTYIGAVTHEEYIGVCFSFNDPKGNDIIVPMDGKLLALSEVPPKMTLRQSFDQASDINLIINLWVDAITTPNVVASFIHLWQIIELIAKKCGPQESLISENHISLVEQVLVEKGYDKEIVKGRISNLIRGLPSSSFVEQAKQGVKRVFCDGEIPENFDDVIRKARKLRGRYVHPQSNIESHSDSFYECYGCLRKMIEDLLTNAKRNLL